MIRDTPRTRRDTRSDAATVSLVGWFTPAKPFALGADNRLTETFVTQALKPALDTVERHWRENWRAGRAKQDENLLKGALILVGNRKQDKFFSNGT